MLLVGHSVGCEGADPVLPARKREENDEGLIENVDWRVQQDGLL